VSSNGKNATEMLTLCNLT